MQKNLDISVLLDFYGDALTPKQREVIEFYYNEDLSLAEIAQIEGITRQGVRDSIKRGESTMNELEQKLGIAARFKRVQDALGEIMEYAMYIGQHNARHGNFNEVGQAAEKIYTLARDLAE